MKHLSAKVSAVALLGALGLANNAYAVPMPGSCPGTVPFGERESAVISADPEQNSNGDFVYRYRVCNTSDPYYGGQVLIDWELPYFDDAGITNIVAPIGWSWSIETVGVQNLATGWGVEDTNGDNVVDDADAVPAWTLDGDPWKAIFDAFYGDEASNPFNFVTQVLHFYFVGEQAEFALAAVDEVTAIEEVFFCDRIFPGENCEGFGFESPFDAGNAPYQASWELLPVRTGDPLFPAGAVPNSPSIQRQAAVPEPASLALVGAGLFAAAAQRRRRSR